MLFPAWIGRIGFTANRRLLGVQRLSHDCTLGADVLDRLHRPALIDGQRASALRFGDPRVQSLLAALLRSTCCPAASATANSARRSLRSAGSRSTTTALDG